MFNIAINKTTAEAYNKFALFSIFTGLIEQLLPNVELFESLIAECELKIKQHIHCATY